jgi:hypothetical protein
VVASRLRRLLLRAADRLLPTHLALLEHSHQFAQAHILSTLAELGVADHLGPEPISAAELAPLVGASPEPLHRLLRAAAVFDAVRLTGDGRFRATRFTRVLRSDHSSGAASWCLYIGSRAHQAAWADLTGSVRTGDGAFRRVHGRSMFEWFDAHPEEGTNFSVGIGGLTQVEAPAIVDGYPFPREGLVCDVGGGQGILLAAVLAARPQVRGVLVDTAPVLDGARDYLDARGLASRVTLSVGDLLSGISATADLYLLKWVLHDWDDATCVRILRTLAAAMPAGARVLVVEGELRHAQVDPRFSMIDLQMLVVTEGGRERSAGELSSLLRSAGLLPGEPRRSATDLVLLDAVKPAA